MAYSELAKSFGRVRDYMRQFFVYGFRSREQYTQKSARSYDNERRRVESWLGDAMSFRQDASGKAVFVSVDSRSIAHNPLYKAFKAKSFTKNDISLHFLLMDMLRDAEAMGIPDILDRIAGDYLPAFEAAEPPDESTLRKKLREYVDLGLIAAEKCGKQLVYRLPEDRVNLDSWREAIAFYSEENPLGAVGSFLLDKFEHEQDAFSFKHHYLLFALDSGIILDLLEAMRQKRRVQLEAVTRDGIGPRRMTTIPLKICISTQGGRQYLAGISPTSRKISFVRLDSIQTVKPLDAVGNYDGCQERLRQESQHFWGVASGNGAAEHLEMTLRIGPEDIHIAGRLEREKRNGSVRQTGETTWVYAVDTRDAVEMLPWLRTFTGRILSLECTDKRVEQRFWADFAALDALYGGGGDAV